MKLDLTNYNPSEKQFEIAAIKNVEKSLHEQTNTAYARKEVAYHQIDKRTSLWGAPLASKDYYFEPEKQIAPENIFIVDGVEYFSFAKHTNYGDFC